MPTPSEYGPGVPETPSPGLLTPVRRMLFSTFYQLRKEYPADLIFVKVLKGEIDPETGKVTNPEREYTLKAVISPVWFTQDIMARFVGKIEKLESVFLVQVSHLEGVEVTTNDYFTHKNRKYKILHHEDFDGVLIALFGETFK